MSGIISYRIPELSEFFDDISYTKLLTKWYEEQDTRSDKSMNSRPEEFFLIEQSILEARSVEFWEFDTVLSINILFKDTQSQDGHRCVEQVIHRYKHGIKQCLCLGERKQNT